MARVKRTVYVTDAKGQAHVLVPGDEVPAWARGLITNPAVLEKSSSTAGPDEGAGQQGTSKTGDDQSSAKDQSDQLAAAEAKAAEAKAAAEAAEQAAAEALGNGAPANDGDDAADKVQGPEAPPRSGKGSGKKAWAEYADRIGVEYPEDADQKAIIAAVDDALAE